MNLAMTAEEEAIASSVETALAADCTPAERNSCAGKVGHAVKESALPTPTLGPLTLHVFATRT